MALRINGNFQCVQHGDRDWRLEVRAIAMPDPPRVRVPNITPVLLDIGDQHDGFVIGVLVVAQIVLVGFAEVFGEC